MFRGRYKAILVEADSYQLQLSRYIHSNPLDAGLVEALENYPWSSYPVYVGDRPAPEWLYCQEVYDQLAVKRRLRDKYRAFVEMGVDEEIVVFYGKGNQAPYLGSDGFRDWAYRQRKTEDAEVSARSLQQFRPDISQVMDSVADCFGVEITSITESQRGRQKENIARWVVMYLGQELCGLKLRQIADQLGLIRTGSIPNMIGKLKLRMSADRGLQRKVRKIKSQYDT